MDRSTPSDRLLVGLSLSSMWVCNGNLIHICTEFVLRSLHFELSKDHTLPSRLVLLHERHKSCFVFAREVAWKDNECVTLCDVYH